jgi:enoyl-CoA hydratase/carnithine racemase
MVSPTSVSHWRLERGTDGAATLWFDQPGRVHNLLDPLALDELDAVLDDVEGTPSIGGLVIRSAKASGFCAGADLEFLLTLRTPAAVESFALKGMAVFDRIARAPKPVVAMIHGVCQGGGLELALACRRRVALASSVPLQMGSPEVQCGLIPFWGGISRLPHLIGPEDGLDLLVSGRSIGYLRARSLGIVDRLAAEGDAVDTVEFLQSAQSSERTWPRDDWEAVWNRVRAQIDSAPGEFPEAQLHVLNLLSIELAHGVETTREATCGALAELTQLDEVRASVQAVIERGAGSH